MADVSKTKEEAIPVTVTAINHTKDNETIETRVRNKNGTRNPHFFSALDKPGQGPHSDTGDFFPLFTNADADAQRKG